MPEWKRKTFGGGKASFGKRTNLSIKEQRESLPVYKLKDQMIQAVQVRKANIFNFNFITEYLNQNLMYKFLFRIIKYLSLLAKLDQGKPPKSHSILQRKDLLRKESFI